MIGNPYVQATYENLNQSVVYLMFKNFAEVMRLSGYMRLIEEIFFGLNGTLVLTTNLLYLLKALQVEWLQKNG